MSILRTKTRFDHIITATRTPGRIFHVYCVSLFISRAPFPFGNPSAGVYLYTRKHNREQRQMFGADLAHFFSTILQSVYVLSGSATDDGYYCMYTRILCNIYICKLYVHMGPIRWRDFFFLSSFERRFSRFSFLRGVNALHPSLF